MVTFKNVTTIDVTDITIVVIFKVVSSISSQNIFNISLMLFSESMVIENSAIFKSSRAIFIAIANAVKKYIILYRKKGGNIPPFEKVLFVLFVSFVNSFL